MPKKEVEILYKEIQNILFKIIPEKWKSLYLYASVINGKGEMYFYYFPKKTLLKPKPINCYEIALKFGINEEQYNIVLKELYNKIKMLNNISIRKWTNITISIVDCLFTIEYNYNDLIHSIYTDEQRHIYWKYKYLNIPIESMNKNDQNLIKYYVQEQNIKPSVYTERIYIENKKVDSEKSNKQTNESEEKVENRVRNQILKC